MSVPAATLPVRAPSVITAPARPAIEPLRMLPGIVISDRDTAQR